MANVNVVMTAFPLTPLAAMGGDEPAVPIRVGFIGLDSSHCTAFTQILNRNANTGDLAGVRVVAFGKAPSSGLSATFSPDFGGEGTSLAQKI